MQTFNSIITISQIVRGHIGHLSTLSHSCQYRSYPDVLPKYTTEAARRVEAKKKSFSSNKAELYQMCHDPTLH